jgi:O-antigen ligase
MGHGSGVIGVTTSAATDERSSALDAPRTLLFCCLLVLVFFWPFELPIAMAVSGVVRPVLGDWYGVSLHATALALVSLIIVSGATWRTAEFTADTRMLALVLTLYLAVGVLALPISSIEPVETKYAYQQFVCGYLAPVLALAAVLSLPAPLQTRLWHWFYAGWVAFLLVSLVLLRVSWQSAGQFSPGWNEIPFLQKLFLWRYNMGEPWNIYGLVMGNANKMSNYLVIFLLFSIRLLSRPNRRAPVLLGAFWILATTTLLVLFSRAALLLLVPVIFLSGVAKRLSVFAVISLVLVAAAALVVVYLIEPRVFEYLFLAQVSDKSEANPAGTFVDRVEMWTTLLNYFSVNPPAAFHGMGTTGYGLKFHNSYEAGTHNLFLDLWTESGVIAPLLFTACIGLTLLTIITARKPARERTMLASGVIVLVLLMTREHSMSYLYVTSMGALCFLVIPYLAIRPGVAPGNTGALAEVRGESA